MPHTNPTFSASSGFDSFSIPIKSSIQSEPNTNRAPELPQTTTVTWSSSKKSLPVDKISIDSSAHSTGIVESQDLQTQPSDLVMSTVAGPTAISANSLRSYPSASVHSSLPVLTAMSGVANPSTGTSMNAPSSGWNLTGNTNASASYNYQFPYSASNQMAANNNNAITTPSSNSSSSAYQYQPHHQHSNSLGSTSNMDLSSNNNFAGHRRVNTESSMPSAQSLTGYAGNFMGNMTDQIGPQSSITASTPTSKPVSLGPLRVHQFFPTTGEAGVPVTVLATVKAEWARQIGLQLTSGIYGGNDTQAARTHGGCRFMLCFGTTEVETRTERSIGMGDSPFNTMSTLEGTSYLSHNANAKDVDLTIIAHAPPYPGPQLQNPSQGGRVQVRIKVVGAPLDASLRQLIDGLDVGEFCYWQVSPRTNLKRPGDDLLAEQHNLRRPASFPALGSQFGQSGSGEDAKFAQPNPNATFPRSQTVARMTEMSNNSSSIPRRPGLPEFPGLSRMASANDIRSIDSMSSISAQTLQQNMQSTGQQYGSGFTPSSQQYSNWGAPSASPSSSLRRNSMGFSSSGLGPGSDMSRPSSDLPSYPMKQQEGSYTGNVTPMPESGQHTPQLIRSTQLNPTSPPTHTIPQHNSFKHSYNASVSTNSSSSPPTDRSGLPLSGSQRANLELHGNIQDMAVGWSHDEWRSRRRLVQFWRKQEGTTIHAICKPILAEEYIPNSVVVSCIFWDVTNECYITSVDVIYLLEALVASRFNVEEKNRIRRNLEGLKPKTISKIAKSGDDKLNKIHEEFFKLVMSFPNPKPRHIEKDIKIFPWRVLASALNKIISKYSAAPLMAAANMQYASAMGMQTPPSGGMQMQPPSMVGMDAGQFGHGAQQNQQDHQQRRLPPGLSIDVDASNASYAPSSAPPAANYGHGGQQQSSQGQGSLLFPPQSASYGRGMNTPGAFGNNGMQNYYPQNSPRKPSLSAGLSGSSTFNFSDFVVSPVAFGQTPLQQAQSLGHYPSSGNQQTTGQAHDQHQSGQSSGLGMDLGNVYKPES